MRQRSSRRQNFAATEEISQRQNKKFRSDRDSLTYFPFGVPLQIPASFYRVCLWIYNCITPRLTGTLTSASFSPRPASPPEWPPAHTKPAARPGHDQRAMALFGPGPYRAHLRPGWSFGPWADRHMPAAGVRPTAPTVSTPAAKRQSHADHQYPRRQASVPRHSSVPRRPPSVPRRSSIPPPPSGRPAPIVSTPAARRQPRAERQYPAHRRPLVVLDRAVRPPTDSDARAGGRPERPRFRR